MAKKIGPFNKMCKEDQESLLKGGCTEIMVIRSVMNYNAAKNAWNVSNILPSSLLPFDFFQQSNRESVSGLKFATTIKRV